MSPQEIVTDVFAGLKRTSRSAQKLVKMWLNVEKCVPKKVETLKMKTN